MKQERTLVSLNSERTWIVALLFTWQRNLLSILSKAAPKLSGAMGAAADVKDLFC